MTNSKKFRFNSEQAGLISSSFNDFTNDAIKEIAADSTIGGLPIIYLKYMKFIYQKVIYGRIIVL